jgi:hypothetical protein
VVFLIPGGRRRDLAYTVTERNRQHTLRAISNIENPTLMGCTVEREREKGRERKRERERK